MVLRPQPSGQVNQMRGFSAAEKLWNVPWGSAVRTPGDSVLVVLGSADVVATLGGSVLSPREHGSYSHLAVQLEDALDRESLVSDYRARSFVGVLDRLRSPEITSQGDYCVPLRRRMGVETARP